MATNLIESLFQTSSFLVKDESTGQSVIDSIKVSRVTIKLTSTPMRHMKEDGSSIVDSRIIQPTTVAVNAFCENIDSLNQINEVVANRSVFYSVSSKGVVLNRMMVESGQTKQSPEFVSAIPIHLVWRQVMSKESTPAVMAQTSNSSMIDRGMTVIGKASKTVSGLVASIAGFF
jgi:hypothetical protein